MTLDQLGNIGELVGGVAVVVTLAYLAIQIRQNSRSVRASTNHAITEQLNDLNLRLGLDPGAVDLMMRGAQNREDLQSQERVRHTLLMRAVLGNYQDIYVQFCEGMCDRETWERTKIGLRETVSVPSFPASWERGKQHCRADFSSEVDALIRATRQGAAS